MNDGVGVRQPSGEFMVISYDEFQAESPGFQCFFASGDAAIHGDNNFHALLGQLPQRLGAQAVAVFQAIGHVKSHGQVENLQEPQEDGGAGDAVGVVVPVNADRQPGSDCFLS